MARHLDPAKLHVTFARGISLDGPLVPRAYTLTHSDFTGELFLTVGCRHERAQISGWYTRLMRDEVLAAWSEDNSPRLDVHCHVSGGLALGTAGLRYGIFRRHLPMVFEAFRQGDGGLFVARPELDAAPIWVHFHSNKGRYDLSEHWGRFGGYAAGAKTESGS